VYLTAFDEAAVQIIRGDLKTYEYRSEESVRWLKMEFCPICGTTVTWTAEAFPPGIDRAFIQDPDGYVIEVQPQYEREVLA
jgi:hypothetical protein